MICLLSKHNQNNCVRFCEKGRKSNAKLNVIDAASFHFQKHCGQTITSGYCYGWGELGFIIIIIRWHAQQ